MLSGAIGADPGSLFSVQLQIRLQAGKIPSPAGHAAEGQEGKEAFAQLAREEAREGAEEGAVLRPAGGPQEEMEVIGGHGAFVEANALERALPAHEGQNSRPVGIEITSRAEHEVEGAFRAQRAALFSFPRPG